MTSQSDRRLAVDLQAGLSLLSFSAVTEAFSDVKINTSARHTKPAVTFKI